MKYGYARVSTDGQSVDAQVRPTDQGRMQEGVPRGGERSQDRPRAAPFQATILTTREAAFYRLIAIVRRGGPSDQEAPYVPLLCELAEIPPDQRACYALPSRPVNGPRECGGPPPRRADTDAFVDRLAERLLRRPWQPMPPPVTEDDRQYRDDASSFALDRLERPLP
jgi:hypothetical protein